MVCPKPTAASLKRPLRRRVNECSTCECAPKRRRGGLHRRRETTHLGGGCEGWWTETDAALEGAWRVQGEEWAKDGGHKSHRDVEGRAEGSDKSTLTEQLGVGEAVQHGPDWGALGKPLESGRRKLRLLGKRFPGGQRQVANEGGNAEPQGRQNWCECRRSVVVYEWLFRILNLPKKDELSLIDESVAA